MKITQAEANYRRGTPIDHCGICMNYLGRHRCGVVGGDVSPYGISDRYTADKRNPFGSTLSGNEKAAIRAMAADAADRAAP